jgi:hypothetical protein
MIKQAITFKGAAILGGQCAPLPAASYWELAPVTRETFKEAPYCRRPACDCKTLADRTRLRLHARGINARPWAVVRTETGAYHAVVIVTGYALDSRYRNPVTLRQLRRDGYQVSGPVARILEAGE